eukprot:5854408-Prymnesium_polylepis.1
MSAARSSRCMRCVRCACRRVSALSAARGRLLLKPWVRIERRLRSTGLRAPRVFFGAQRFGLTPRVP